MKEKESNPPYLPSLELIEDFKKKLKLEHFRKKENNNSKPKSNYSRSVITVPRDTRQIVGTNYQ
jgi:hypothetical protein